MTHHTAAPSGCKKVAPHSTPPLVTPSTLHHGLDLRCPQSPCVTAGMLTGELMDAKGCDLLSHPSLLD